MRYLFEILTLMVLVLLSPFIVFMWMKWGTFGYMKAIEKFRNSNEREKQNE